MTSDTAMIRDGTCRDGGARNGRSAAIGLGSDRRPQRVVIWTIALPFR